jgi:membrane associated rhomboid family serine protease
MWDDLKRQWNSGNMLTRLIFANVGVFTAVMTFRLLAKTGALDAAWVKGVFGLATTWDVEVLLHRPWSVFTHMFVHVDLWHLVINMAWLYWMGRLFMVQFGARRLLSTYCVGGLAGFVLYALAANASPAFQSGTFAFGASAAVMAIMAATATAQPNYTVRLFLLGAVPLKYLAIGWVLLDYFALGNGTNAGGNVAHLGGAVFGYLMIKQSQAGRDWVGWFERLLDAVMGLVQGGTIPSPRRKTRFRKVKDTRSTRVKTDEEFNREKRDRADRMDAILDKVSKQGYDNLTADEKEFLFRQSNK